VITEDQTARLSDHEAINLSFQPGFSTASEVSDLSGRGVGMDVVRSNIEKMGGQVTVSSTVGVAATVRLSLPLSMAVTRVMIRGREQPRWHSHGRHRGDGSSFSQPSLYDQAIRNLRLA
jgi:chemotaxis protein histidine kinase CheA